MISGCRPPIHGPQPRQSDMSSRWFTTSNVCYTVGIGLIQLHITGRGKTTGRLLQSTMYRQTNRTARHFGDGGGLNSDVHLPFSNGGPGRDWLSLPGLTASFRERVNIVSLLTYFRIISHIKQAISRTCMQQQCLHSPTVRSQRVVGYSCYNVRNCNPKKRLLRCFSRQVYTNY